MNEEEKEAIKDSKDILKELNKNKDKDFIGRLYYKNKPIEDILQILLNLIEKQQKEIEDLKAITREYESYKVGEGDNIVIASKNWFVDGFFEEYLNKYISKDKIKEKIKEIESLPMLDFAEKEKFDFKYSLDGLYCMQKGVVFILKELLGETNVNK